MTVALQQPGMLFNGLDVMMTEPHPVYGYLIQVMSGDTAFGDPDAVISKIQSQLQDGDLQRVDRYGNRTATLVLKVSAPGAPDSAGAAVAAGQQAIELAAGFTGWAELMWTSPMAGAETSVMEMTSAVPSKALDTTREMGDGVRLVKVTIGARPFVRAVEPTVIEALDVSGSTTVPVDDGSSTTGWSLLSTRPATVTNLETNPDFATNVAGYSAGDGTRPIRWSTYPTDGTTVAEMQVDTPALKPGGKSYLNGPVHTVAEGQKVEVGSIVKRPLDGGTGALVQFFSDPSGSALLGGDIILAPKLGTSPISWVVTVPTGAIRMRVYRYGQQGAAMYGSPWHLDKQWTAISDDPTGVGYFDGSKAATPAVTYAWTGTPNASTSTATWTAPSLAAASGAVKGTVYGRASAAIRRTGAIDMSSLNYMRIKGTASAFSDGQVSVADNGGAPLTPISYSYNATSGTYEIVVKRPEGFTKVDVAFTRTSGTISTATGLFIGVDQIDITNAPFGTGKVQMRQVEVYGSQRTELSLSVLGLDAAGSPIALGEQVLVYTASAGTDGRAKFLACRAAAALTGTTDATAVSGTYNTMATTSSPTAFTFPASTLLPGSYQLVARVRSATAGANTLSFRSYVLTSDPINQVYDPRTGWKSVPLTVTASGAAWPQVNTSSWVMLPLGVLRLPPADVEDLGATITIQVARGAAAVDLDEVFLLNADVGQASLMLLGAPLVGSYSAVRLDAATVDEPQALAWVGTTGGTMVADVARWVGEQHAAAPGFLQIASVTPGCPNPRVSASYYRRNTHDMAPQAA